MLGAFKPARQKSEPMARNVGEGERRSIMGEMRLAVRFAERREGGWTKKNFFMSFSFEFQIFCRPSAPRGPLVHRAVSERALRGRREGGRGTLALVGSSTY